MKDIISNNHTQSNDKISLDTILKIIKYFSTEYLIPVGTPAPDGSCHFTYRSISRKVGRFNSPRHPANYPSSTYCTYNFLATSQEQVRSFLISIRGKKSNIIKCCLQCVTFMI